MTTYIETFDDMDDVYGSEVNESQKPFQFREDTSEEGTLKWLQQNFEDSLLASKNRLDWYREASALFKGDLSYNGKEDGRKPKHGVNFVQDMVENRVASRARISPNLTVIPKHDSQISINSSRGVKKLLDYNAAEINLEESLQDQDRRMFKFGTGILHIFWDENAGPVKPAYAALEENYKGNIPKSITSKIKGNIHVGDVNVEEISPARFYPERFKSNFKKVDYVDLIDFINMHELRAEYPIDSEKIQADDSNILLLLKRTHTDEVIKHTFLHKPTKYLPEGARIVWSNGAIHSWTKFPYKHGKLPFDISRDIKLDGIWGMSIVHNIKQLQRTYNNIQSATAYDISSVARKKWMVYKNSARFSSLDNDSTVCEWSGKHEPRLVSNTPMTSGMMPFQDKVEGQIAKQSRVYDISRGETPPGITANSALQFMDEQETNRDIVGIVNKKTRIRDIGRMRMSLMDQFYSTDDDRTIRILGPENVYLIESMAKVDFDLAASVELENTSKLPDSKTGMLSAIIDMNAMTQTDPVFKRDHVMQLLDMGNNEIFKSRASVAVTAAKTTLDRLLSGDKIVEPQASDDHLVYYDTFLRAMQGTTYRTKTPPHIKAALESYITVLEGLMYFRALRNPKFMMQVLDLDMYPIYFEMPAPLMPMMEPPTKPTGGSSKVAADAGSNLTKQLEQGE